MSQHPPFRADVVGSYLRPTTLAQARTQHAAGEITTGALHDIENAEIAALVARQRECGLRLATDGELRRSWWHFDFFGGLTGVEVVELDHGIQFQGVQTKPQGVRVNGKIGFDATHPFLTHFAALRDLLDGSGVQPKFSIPSPAVLDFRLEAGAIDSAAYNDRAEIVDDLVDAYRDAIAAFYAAGARYLQLDDTAWAYLCSDAELEKARSRGIVTDGIAERYAALLNRVLADRPDDLVVTTHICRGNFRSTWVSSGGYEPVAEQLLAVTDYDGYFLEYDTDRAGGFEPLRFLPAGDKRVVLGLVTTKDGSLEEVDVLRRRIDEAAEFVSVDQLALSPQCGFASTEEGNNLTEDEQWAKVRRVVEVADTVWR